MSALNDLISQISDPALRERIQQEVNKMSKQKKFGLVFEEHLPEMTKLYDIPVKRGSNVMYKTGSNKEVYKVIAIKNDIARCVKKSKPTVIEEFNLRDLVCVAEFGEPIYPYLKYMDSICNDPDSELWHTLIEADNYHALQLLEYMYAGKVDCIYIDPPYNTGARDWKYNNDYVDGSDTYRHSKWLSFMEKRLKLAKKLLNPRNSVLIITIDEKEYLHLGCLLEEIFPECEGNKEKNYEGRISTQMISDAINPKGVARMGFRRNDEYIFFIMLGSCTPDKLPLENEWSTSATIAAKADKKSTGKTITPDWTSMMRRGSNSSREHSPGCYYPIYANPKTKTIEVIGEPIPTGQHQAQDIEGLTQILPIRTNGAEGCWQVSPSELKTRMEQGRIRLGRETSYGFVVNYLPDGAYADVISGEWSIEGFDTDGSIIATKSGDSAKLSIAPTQWKIASHNASENGSSFITSILTDDRFSYPKSLYSTYDAIKFFVSNKPNALILDFFAGSGTTMHAINLLNSMDNGKRRCILVTNNEVSDAESKELTKRGLKPGDTEWEKYGIARYVTWPRTVCSIIGKDVKGEPLKGVYLGSNIKLEDGFKSNAIFFKLGFLDKTSVHLGKELSRLMPVLWMKSGAIGKCPNDTKIEDGMVLLPENKMAILIDEVSFPRFLDVIKNDTNITTAYIVSDSEAGYREMASYISNINTFQLYRDYIDTFRINIRR